MPLGETEAATCRTMKESRYLFRYFGVCAQRAEVSRFRCAYRCRYKAVEPSPPRLGCPQQAASGPNGRVRTGDCKFRLGVGCDSGSYV